MDNELRCPECGRVMESTPFGVFCSYCKKLFEIIMTYKEIGGEKIDSFKGDYFFLSNFYPVNMEYRGQKFLSSEAAFQCQKCANEEDKEIFSRLEPREAKAMGRKVKMSKSWEADKVWVMSEIVYEKFTQVPALGEKLLSTGNIELVEGNTWGDHFWGACFGQGSNWLGKILMKTREKIRKEKNE